MLVGVRGRADLRRRSSSSIEDWKAANWDVMVLWKAKLESFRWSSDFWKEVCWFSKASSTWVHRCSWRTSTIVATTSRSELCEGVFLPIGSIGSDTSWYTQSIQELKIAIIENSVGNFKRERREVEAKRGRKVFSFIHS